jgi:hypothetical protein
MERMTRAGRKRKVVEKADGKVVKGETPSQAGRCSEAPKPSDVS